MRNHLIHLLFSTALYANFFMCYGQDAPSGLTKNIPEPLYILNTNIIANGCLSNLDTRKIKQIVVYKGVDGPGLLKNITSTGMLLITYEGEVNSKSFTELGTQYGLQKFNVTINGHLLNASQLSFLRIAPESIEKLVVKPQTNESSFAVMDIKLVKTKLDNQNKLPGTIMIR